MRVQLQVRHAWAETEQVRGFDADDSGVTVHLANGDAVRAAWLVGCDGGRGLVRRLAGIEFPGTDPEITGRQGVFTVEGADQLKPGWQHTPTATSTSTDPSRSSAHHRVRQPACGPRRTGLVGYPIFVPPRMESG